MTVQSDTHDFEHQRDLKPGDSALSVDRTVDPNAKPRKLPRRKKHGLDEMVPAILAGDRAMLGRAVTMVESNNPQHQREAGELLTRVLAEHHEANKDKPASPTIRVGITGVPGVGKSTFIEALGTMLTGQGRKVAVLAVDPTSAVSGGSILGDKTRMAKLSVDANAFIRPSPAGRTLGGVAAKTREALLLCEAAGFDTILVETVGVGQSETAVAEMTDVFLALMLAGAGDELQGIKRGLLELVDVLAINKADGDNIHPAQRAASQYRSALHLLQPRHANWTVPITTCSAATHTNIDEVWSHITTLHDQLMSTGSLDIRRHKQSLIWMYDALKELSVAQVFENPKIIDKIPEMEQQVESMLVTPKRAAQDLFNLIINE